MNQVDVLTANSNANFPSKKKVGKVAPKVCELLYAWNSMVQEDKPSSLYDNCGSFQLSMADLTVEGVE